MPSAETIEYYFGPPPHYRHTESGEIRQLPFRIRLADGSTRTNPTQWALEPGLLAYAGFEVATVTDADIATRAPAPKTLEELRIEKTAALSVAWTRALGAGFYTTGYTDTGWRLKLNNEDVTLLTGAFLMLKEYTTINPAATTTIVDYEDVPHELDLAAMTPIMLAYGDYRANLSAQELALKTAIKNATTEEELAAIDLTFTLSTPPTPAP